MAKDDDGQTMYWGWYTISCLKGQMKPKNIDRGIRLRKGNIQIGDEEICKKFFTKTEDQRFSFYYFGEIHALGKGLIPNSRRDYFSESKECTMFERRIKQDFLKLKDLCYDAQKLRSSATTIEKGMELQSKIEEKEQNGYTSQNEREDLQRQLEEQQKKEMSARKQLEKVRQKIEGSDSPLKRILDNFNQQTQSAVPQEEHTPTEEPERTKEKPKFRTDKPIYSRFSKQEKKLIGRIYTAISNAIADEKLRDTLISKIEEQITK